MIQAAVAGIISSFLLAIGKAARDEVDRGRGGFWMRVVATMA